VIEVMKQLKTTNHQNIVYGVGTVQEEVGLRGAKTATALVNPDLAIAIDVGIGGGTPGVDLNDSAALLGSGPLVVVYDSALMASVNFKNFIIKTCQKNNIPFQLVAKLGGGTDAGAMSLAHSGTPAISISLPSRYIHSHSSVIHEDDFNSIVKLIVQLITDIDKNNYKTLI